MINWQDLHFLRPEWLWALLLVPAALLGMSFLGRLSAFEARPDGLILRG